MTTEESSKWITTNEAATIVGRSRNAILRWIKAYPEILTGKAKVDGHRAHLVELGSLLKFANRCNVENPADTSKAEPALVGASASSETTKWVTTNEAAIIVGRSAGTVRCWIREDQDILSRKSMIGKGLTQYVELESLLKTAEKYDQSIPSAKTPSATTKWLTTKEAAALLDRDENTIRVWIKQETTILYKKELVNGSYTYFIDRRSLLKIAKRRNKSTIEARASSAIQRLKSGIRKLAAKIPLPDRKPGDPKPLRRIAQEGGLPRSRSGKLNIKALLLACDLSPNRYTAPVRARIVRYVAYVVDDTVKNHDLVISVPRHGKFYSFRRYEALGPAFVRRMALCLKNYMEFSVGTAKSASETWRKFNMLFGWVKDNINNFPEVRDSLLANMAPPADAWAACLMAFRQELMKDSEVNVITKLKNHHKAIVTSKINTILQDFTRNGLFPPVRSLKLPVGWRTGWTGNRKKSLAELPKSNFVDLKSILDAAENKLGSTACEDKAAFITTLMSEQVTPSMLPEAQAMQFADIIEKRLGLLRCCAEEEFLKWWGVYERGQELLVGCDLNYDVDILPLIGRYLELSRGEKISKYLLGQGLRSVLFVEDSEQAIARYLKIVEHRWSGLMPVNNLVSWELAPFNISFCKKYGGREFIEAHLHAHSHATVALRVMLLVDTGVNVDVLNDMPFECLKETDQKGQWQLLLGHKWRAKGAAIYDILKLDDGNRLSTVRAIQMYQQMTARLRKVAQNGVKEVLWPTRSHEVDPRYQGKLHEYLFVSRRNKPHLPLTVYGATDNGSFNSFKSFVQRHEVLKDIPYRQDAIRPSLLLYASIKDDANITVAQVIAQHKPGTTTSRYTNKYPLQLMWNRKIRNFQSLIEAVLIENIDQGWKKIGLSKLEYDVLLSEAHRTGLGVACRNPKAGVQPGTMVGVICDKQENCPSCEMRYVPATPDNVLDLVLFNRCLRELQPRMEVEQPEMWASKWMPWLVFTDVALDKLSRGLNALVLKEAQTKAAGVIIDGRFAIY